MVTGEGVCVAVEKTRGDYGLLLVKGDRGGKAKGVTKEGDDGFLKRGRCGERPPPHTHAQPI